MISEAGKYSEEDKKKKKKSILDKKENLEKRASFEKRKEKLKKEEQKDATLSELKYALERGEISSNELIQMSNETQNNTSLDTQEISEILQKIVEISEMVDVEKYLPKELIVTKDEYKKSLTDKKQREVTLQKIDDALIVLTTQNRGKTKFMLFTGYLALLDKNLVLLQENHIDIKRSLITQQESNFWCFLRSFIKK